MYPARFEYSAATTLDEALSSLDRFGEEGKVLAGGQSLIPLMKLRFASPGALVDINRVEGLDGLSEEAGELRIGALVRHKACERSELLAGRWGVLGDAAPQISDPLVRNLGTVGGSLAHADPQGDWGSALMAADARVVAQSAGGRREISLEDFFAGPFTTALEPNEVLTEIRVPDPGPRAAGTYLKLERRVGDFATVGVGRARVVRRRQGGARRASRSRRSARATCARTPPRPPSRGHPRRGHDQGGGAARRRGRRAPRRQPRLGRLQAQRRARVRGARAPQGRGGGAMTDMETASRRRPRVRSS